MRILINRISCNYCNEDTLEYLVLDADGYSWDVEGCGGYVGRGNGSRKGILTKEEAEKILRGRREELRREREDMLDDIRQIESHLGIKWRKEL